MNKTKPRKKRDEETQVIHIEPLVLSPRQTAKALNISLSQLYKAWREERGPPYFHEGVLRFCTHDNLKKYVEQRQRDATLKQGRVKKSAA